LDPCTAWCLYVCLADPNFVSGSVIVDPFS
jgi:hypothetical protein